MSKLYTVVEIVRVFNDNDGKVFWRMRNGAYVPGISRDLDSLFKLIPVFSMVAASIYIKKVRVIILMRTYLYVPMAVTLRSASSLIY